MPKNDIELEFFTVISDESLLVYESKYYMQVYLNNCAYNIANKKNGRIEIREEIGPTKINRSKKNA